MAGTLWNPQDHEPLFARLARLTPDVAPRWGRMGAGRMVVHLTDTLRMATGELRCAAAPKGPLARPVIKQLVMFYLPWPKGAPTAPELLERAPVEWTQEVDTLRKTIARFPSQPRDAVWPLHPSFGRITGTEWGRLMYRHIEHHLTQFGV